MLRLWRNKKEAVEISTGRCVNMVTGDVLSADKPSLGVQASRPPSRFSPRSSSSKNQQHETTEEEQRPVKMSPMSAKIRTTSSSVSKATQAWRKNQAR